MMLLYLSSGFVEYLSRFLDGGEDFASNVAFETADDVALAHSLRGSTPHVCLGPRVKAQPDDNYAIESRIGLTVATSVETMPVGLAGRCWDRVHTAQRCEGCLGMKAIRVAARRDQQGCSRVGSHTEGIDQGRRD